MRRIALLLLLTACGPDELELRGTLADGVDVSEVAVAGAALRAPVEGDSFHLAGVRGDTVRIVLASEGDTARMQLTELAPGARLRLEEVWVDDGVAFPTRVALEGAKGVTVNGVRMGPLPDEVNVTATVLAAARDGSALVLRPAGGELPDLRVVVLPTTEVATEDGDPVEARRLAFGDTVRVTGAPLGPYLAARTLTLGRALALRTGDDAEADEDEDGERSSADAAERAEPERERRDDDGGAARSGEGRGEERGGGKGRGRGKEKGKGKGRGKG